MPSIQDSEALLRQYITTPSLIEHSQMVALALRAYARRLGQDEDYWYQVGLLHDLDWEAYPEEHPTHATTELLQEYPEDFKRAINSHGFHRTQVMPETPLERLLFASDELSGLMRAVALMKENGFADVEVKSVKKKIKNKAFAAKISREDIQYGFDLIADLATPEEHIGFLIETFRNEL